MSYDYDVITVGAGLGGAALGKALAEQGMRVLLLEREIVFRDRVRGEYVHPWGVTEAKALGLYELLKQSCAHEARFRVARTVGLPAGPVRDLVATTPHKAGSLHFFHPSMQEVVLEAARRAGAVVQRGVSVAQVLRGSPPSVRVRAGESERTYRARLIAGADGRTSACRRWAGFALERDPDRMVIAGALFERLSAPEDRVCAYSNPERGLFAFVIPLGDKRFRCYAGYYQQDGRRPMSGAKAADAFVATCTETGMPAEWFEHAQATGPLASFDCTDSWVPHPYRHGVVLLGDAAGVSDPVFGCGLSLTLRDARVLSGVLAAATDWDAAAHAYAAEHDRYFASIHRQLTWLTQLYYEPGDAAASRRARAFARLAEDATRAPDIPGLGPESPSDEAAYRNLFGDD